MDKITKEQALKELAYLLYDTGIGFDNSSEWDKKTWTDMQEGVAIAIRYISQD